MDQRAGLLAGTYVHSCGSLRPPASRRRQTFGHPPAPVSTPPSSRILNSPRALRGLLLCFCVKLCTRGALKNAHQVFKFLWGTSGITANARVTYQCSYPKKEVHPAALPGSTSEAGSTHVRVHAGGSRGYGVQPQPPIFSCVWLVVVGAIHRTLRSLQAHSQRRSHAARLSVQTAILGARPERHHRCLLHPLQGRSGSSLAGICSLASHRFNGTFSTGLSPSCSIDQCWLQTDGSPL